ncbi:MAG: phosphohydrolase [Oscillospiraceae bacterium]|nr:phosphohydrolase [Oscillospiraceae bacterium]
MEYIITYRGEKFTPHNPNIHQIHIEDIAHSLSLMCRANGHIDYFYSIAQHSINCAIEAKYRGYSARIQLACLIHDANESYISDITRPVKQFLPDYKEIEQRLQSLIYKRFMNSELSDDEFYLVNAIDDDMLKCEFNSLMKGKRVFDSIPILSSMPTFKYKNHVDVETEFLKVYYGIMHAGIIQGK